MSEAAFLRCIQPTCAATIDLTDPRYDCPTCGALLDVAYDWDRLQPPGDGRLFDERAGSAHEPLDFSGVWRFRELFPFAPHVVMVNVGDGQTLLQSADVSALVLPI